MSEISYTCPDGLVTLSIVADEADTTLGFVGYSWHTHGDVLSGEYLLREGIRISPQDAVTRLIEDLLADKLVIAVSDSQDGKRDVWKSWDPLEDATSPNVAPGERMYFRYWSGRPWSE